MTTTTKDTEALEMMPAAVISTAHLSVETRDWLDGLSVADLPFSGFAGLYGWIFFVGDGSWEEPADLVAALTWARERDLEWLRFDADASQVDGLKVWES